MVTINKIPVYNAILGDDCGMMRISLVDEPAVMSNFQAFDKDKAMLLYRVADEEQRKVLGVVMRADFPIYRRDDKMGEFYIIYERDTIEEMAQKYLAEGRANNVNLMHEEGTDVEGVEMVQYFIKDSAKGIAPEGFDEVADGSLFAEFKVENDTIWDAIKEGTYKGFSLEGYFDLVPSDDKDEVDRIVEDLEGKFKRFLKNKKENMNKKLEKIMTALASAMAVEFKAITTDKGVLNWDTDEDLKAGDEVFGLDENGEHTAIADDDYTTEDGKVIIVVDSKVAEIKDAEAEVAPEEAAAEEEKKKEAKCEEETPAEDPEEEPKESDLEARVKSLETLVAKMADWMGIVVVETPLVEQMSAIKADLEAIKKTPAASPAHTEFKRVDNPSEYGANENLVRILNAKRN